MSKYSIGHIVESIKNLENNIFRGSVSIPIENSIRLDVLSAIVKSIQKESPTTLLNSVAKNVSGGSTEQEIADRAETLATKPSMINTEDTSTVLDEVADYKTILGTIQSLYNILKGNNETPIAAGLPDEYKNVVESIVQLYEAIQSINVEVDTSFDIFGDMYSNFNEV
jgi:hypothetical protein